MHNDAFSHPTDSLLEHKGIYSFRKDGEKHAWNPDTISMLQLATRLGSYKKFKEYSHVVDEKESPIFLRDFLTFKQRTPIPLEQVEPKEAIMRRFVTGAMSFGSISREAHETIAIAMNKIHGRSNTGEGGEDSARFIPREDGLSLRSAIKQVASGRFGVTTEYLVNADEIQIKVAQGAKPGEGGQLPGYKVNDIIARTRHSIPGISHLSPTSPRYLLDRGLGAIDLRSEEREPSSRDQRETRIREWRGNHRRRCSQGKSGPDRDLRGRRRNGGFPDKLYPLRRNPTRARTIRDSTDARDERPPGTSPLANRRTIENRTGYRIDGDAGCRGVWIRHLRLDRFRLCDDA